MQFKSLYLKNYGIFKETTFNFKEGFNVLSGENGQGKSHVLRAINYLLLNKTFGKIEEDCNWGADSFDIKLEFEHNGQTFIAHNTFDRKKGVSKELWIDKEYYSGNKDVTEVLSLYFEPSLTSAAMIALQGDMDVVTSGSAKRRDNLKKIYDLDFTKQINYVKEEKEVKDKEIQEIDKKIYHLEQKEYKKERPQKLPFSEDDKRGKKEEIERIQQTVRQQETILNAKQEKENLIDTLGEKITNKQAKLSQMERERGELQSKASEDSETLINLREAREGELQSTKEDLDKIVIERVKAFDDQILEKAYKEYLDTQNELKQAREHLSLVKQGQCPVCKRAFDSGEESTYTQKIEELEKEEQKRFKHYTELSEEKKKLDKLREEQKQKLNEKTRLETQLSHLGEVYQSKIENALNVQKQHIEQKVSLHKAIKESLKELVDLEKQKKEAKDSLEALEKEIKDFDIDFLTSMKKELEEEIAEYDRVVSTNEIIVKNNQKVEEEKQEDAKEMGQLKKQRESAVRQSSICTTEIDILKKTFPNFVISTLVHSIESGMNELLDKAYAGRYHCSIKESRSGLDVVYADKEVDIKLSSGAEQNLFNLGFKNAFTKIAGLKLLVLDEALNFANDTIAKNVFHAIKDMIDEGTIEQVLLITHKDEVKDMLASDYSSRTFTIKEGEIERTE